MPPDNQTATRVIVVATNASTVSGGEAVLPWHYFRLLRRRGVDAHLVTHERNRSDLAAQAEMEGDRVWFVRDSLASRFLSSGGRRLPVSLKALTVWPAMGAVATVDLRRVVRRLVLNATGPVVVHEPIPVSPKSPSFMATSGAGFVIGPLNGGMEYPDGFRQQASSSERAVRALLRSVAGLAGWIFPARAHADVVLVANERTRRALPRRVRRVRTIALAENGVDLAAFHPNDSAAPPPSDRFAFVGRLVDWKRVDLALRALQLLPEAVQLDVVGDGPEAEPLARLATDLDVADRVHFHGHQDQAYCSEVMRNSTALLLPSVYECGGAVVLEAMAVSRAVVATDWGGPADYLEHEVSGLLVEPASVEAVVEGLAAAMARLTKDSDLTVRLGRHGRQEIENRFSWDRKIDQIVDIYASAARRPTASGQRARRKLS